MHTWIFGNCREVFELENIMEGKYKEIIGKCENRIAGLNKTANIIGVVKLIIFALLIYSIYQLYVTHLSLKWIAVGFIEIIVFVLACKNHNSAFDSIAYYTGLIEISENNIKRISGEWIRFQDIGEEYMDYNHRYAMDLDIVGRNSLFQFLNSTNTYHGRTRLADDLLHSRYGEKEIRERQKAVRELSDDYEWTSGVEYLFSRIGVDPFFSERLAELQKKNVFSKSRILSILLNVLRLVTCAAMFLAVFVQGSSTRFFEGMILLQLILWMLGYCKIKAYLGYMKTIPCKFSPYNDVIDRIINKVYDCDKLNSIKIKMAEAQEGISELTRISSNINQCNNGITCFILNALFLWDYKNALDYQKWKQKYSELVETWFLTLGELESLISFTNLSRNCDTVCIPTITNQNKHLYAKQIGHPLIRNGARVCNDFKMGNDIVIISGSNMSGKSTFMRAIGINAVLANAGSYVCAEQMECSLFNILTSMRIVDHTTEGLSTFYSELVRIKEIIGVAGNNKNTFFLIDEIFRGTNSVDRLKGAEGVLKKLNALKACGLITTHDLEICRLEKEYGGILNYSFYEEYRDDEIYFDYKIKRGVSKTRNAEFLLKKVGIL